MNGITTGLASRPPGLVRLVALMAAHRDTIATPHGCSAPLEQRHIERIVEGLSAIPVKPASTARRHPRAAPGR